MCDIMCDIIEKERAEGMAEGMLEGIAISVISILGGETRVPDQLKKEIYGQRDTKILTDWVKIAAQADSPEDFAEKIQSPGKR